MKNVLVIGGSYFIGRVFVQNLAKIDGYTVHVLNRGRYPLHIEGVLEYKCDRRDLAALKKVLPQIKFDAVVDFCAYLPDDAKTILESFSDEIGQYIYISSCVVYESSFDYPRYEDSPKIKSQQPGPVGEYAFGKRMLELEFRKLCLQKNIPLTILRPSFVYGPYNYAPRESFFFKLIQSVNLYRCPIRTLPSSSLYT